MPRCLVCSKYVGLEHFFKYPSHGKPASREESLEDRMNIAELGTNVVRQRNSSLYVNSRTEHVSPSDDSTAEQVRSYEPTKSIPIVYYVIAGGIVLVVGIKAISSSYWKKKTQEDTKKYQESPPVTGYYGLHQQPLSAGGMMQQPQWYSNIIGGQNDRYH